MDAILKVLGGFLGVATPILFLVTLRKGIRSAPFGAASKATYERRLIAAVSAWTLAVWAAALCGLFSYHPGDAFPRFIVPLFAPTLLGMAMMTNGTFRVILDHTPLSALVRAQGFRLIGSALFLVVYAGVLPSSFNINGVGDVLTGTLAILASKMLARRSRWAGAAFWGFTLAGTLDLIGILILGLACYPIWSTAAISSAPMGAFSLVMLPAVAAPVALMLHAYAVRNYFTVRGTAPVEGMIGSRA